MYTHSYFNPQISIRLVPLLLILITYVILELITIDRKKFVLKPNSIRISTNIIISGQMIIILIFDSYVGMSACSFSYEVPKVYNIPYYFTIGSIITGMITFVIGCFFIIKLNYKDDRRKYILKHLIISVIVITSISSYCYSLQKYVKPDNYFHKIVELK